MTPKERSVALRKTAKGRTNTATPMASSVPLPRDRAAPREYVPVDYWTWNDLARRGWSPELAASTLAAPVLFGSASNSQALCLSPEGVIDWCEPPETLRTSLVWPKEAVLLAEYDRRATLHSLARSVADAPILWGRLYPPGNPLPLVVDAIVDLGISKIHTDLNIPQLLGKSMASVVQNSLVQGAIQAYLRHHLTNYDRSVRQGNEDYLAIRTAIDTSLGELYPFLANLRAHQFNQRAQEAEKRWCAGDPPTQIARELGLDNATLYAWRDKYKWPKRPGPK
ncbi:MAG: hypothetical protein ACHQ9S_25625 [Candidatus Binatia bacterium]